MESSIVFFRKRYKKPKRLNKFQVLVRNLLNLMWWMVILLIIVLFGAGVFKHLEDWPIERAVYFSAVTVSSLGYGDFHLNNDKSKWFDCFYMIIFVSTTALCLNKISSFKRHLNKAELWQILEEIELSKPLLDAIDPKTHQVSRSDYILHMLQLEGKLDYERDLIRWHDRFDEFDVDKDNYLTMKDVSSFSMARERNLILQERSQSNYSSNNNNNNRHGSHVEKGIFWKFIDEARDVFLETLGIRQLVDTNSTSIMREDNSGSGSQSPKSDTVVSPLAKAKALRRASAVANNPTASIDGVEMKSNLFSSKDDEE